MRNLFCSLMLCMSILSVSAVTASDTLSSQHPEYLPALEIGAEVPDFSAPDTLGLVTRLSDLRGDYVVLDLWASWCGDCRRETPRLIDVYKRRRGMQMNGHKVQWIGYSFDDRDSLWRSFLRQAEMPWTQVSRLMRTKNDPLFRDLQLHWIPAFLLISPEGKLVGKAITAEGLEQLLVEEEHLSDFATRVAALPGVTSVERIPSSEYPEKYLVTMQHPLDYDHPEKGTFAQRIIVCHAGYDRPTVMVTEGYGAQYDLREDGEEEISKLLQTNLVVVEYRYFLESMPNPCNWDYLTVRNSLYDLHDVNVQLRKLYPGKWLATGISKGGQTCMFYRAYFPDDVDVSVPYVAPLNKGVVDGRHESFLTEKVGTAQGRTAMKNFQVEILKRRAVMVPMLQQYCAEKGYVFNEGVGMDEVLDMCVLEYAYAMWQWGTDVHTIPDLQSTDSELFDYLMGVSGPDYFRPDPYFLSFFVQAARELGYYGYDDNNLRPYLSIKSSDNYLHRLMLPAELDTIRFHNELYKHTVKYLRENDPRMIFIYGENDPWSASGVHTWLDFSRKRQMHLFVDPSGSHRARISTLPPTQSRECLALLREWLGLENESW